jgi:SAM-dependent methyltransferase
VLDIGCGFGRHLLKALAANPRLAAVGVDINSRMIEEANRAAHKSRMDRRATFLVGDASLLEDLQGRRFDLAICMTNTLGNMPREKQIGFLDRVRELLCPGGRLMLSVYSLASTSALLESYRRIGLHVEEIPENRQIVATGGLESQAFDVGELRFLIEQSGLNVVRIDSLTPMSLNCRRGAPASAGDDRQPLPPVPPVPRRTAPDRCWLHRHRHHPAAPRHHATDLGTTHLQALHSYSEVRKKNPR